MSITSDKYQLGAGGPEHGNVAKTDAICNLDTMTRSTNYDSLMHEVCVDLGWCGGIVDGKPIQVDDFIPASGPVTAEQFVHWLFRAEGMDPFAELRNRQKHMTKLTNAFIQHMGAEVVDASMLKRS